MRLVGYRRISREDDASTAIERQGQEIIRYADRYGHELVAIVDDVGVSATRWRLNRPGLDKVRAMVAAGKADGVLVYRLDRLARSVRDVSELLAEGLPIVSCTEAIDTVSPSGRAMVQVAQVFAELEAATIAARVRDAVNHLRESGRFPGGVVPFGYRTCRLAVGRGLEPEPAEAAVVREMAERVLTGESLYRVTRDLNDRGVPPRRAEKWSPRTVKQLLLSDGVLGRVIRQGKPVVGPDGYPATPWEPLLTVEQSQRLRAMFGPADRRPGRVKAARLLSGLVRCASCQGTMVVGQRRSGLHSYRCPSHAHASPCPRPVAIGAEWLEELVERQLLTEVGELPEYVVHRTAGDLSGLAAVGEALARVGSELVQPDADVPALLDQRRALLARQADLALAQKDVTERLVPTGRTNREAWESAQTPERRALLRGQLVRRIEVGPGVPGHVSEARVDVPWVFTFEAAGVARDEWPWEVM